MYGADVLPEELLKAGGEMMVEHKYQLLCKIRLLNSMPDAGNQSVIYLVLKKSDNKRCENYRGISNTM